MDVILFKLDNPSNKHEWWVKDIKVKTRVDIEQLLGFCGEHLYAEILHIDENDDLALVNIVKDILLGMPTETAKDTIMRLFKAGVLCNG